MGKKNIEFAVKAIVLCEGKFLALHRKDTNGKWFDLPGGHMEYGETAEDTVIREVKEEAGLDIRPIRVLDTWNSVREEYQITGIFYLCEVIKFPAVKLSEEHDFYEWFSINEESINNMHDVFKIKMKKWNWNEMN